MIVIDASVAASWLFEDERSDYAMRAFEMVREGDAVVPAIFPLEVANAILIARRRGRLSTEAAEAIAAAFERLPITVKTESLSIRDELAIAEKHGLTVYDAQYLVVAREHRARLFTLDQRLRSAAAAENLLGTEQA